MATKKLKHTWTGNCHKPRWMCSVCGKGENCDVCHLHDLPRGECKKCQPCPACQRDGE